MVSEREHANRPSTSAGVEFEVILLKLNIQNLKFLNSVLTRGTCLAVDLIRAVVLAVIEEVAAQRGADASAVGTQELILLTCLDRGQICGNIRQDTCKQFIT